jgi:hypothetical protein
MGRRVKNEGVNVVNFRLVGNVRELEHKSAIAVEEVQQKGQKIGGFESAETLAFDDSGLERMPHDCSNLDPRRSLIGEIRTELHASFRASPLGLRSWREGVMGDNHQLGSSRGIMPFLISGSICQLFVTIVCKLTIL